MTIPQQPICNTLIKHSNPSALYDPTPHGYTHLTRIKITDIDEIIHISGQGGANQTGQYPESFSEQCAMVFQNIQYALFDARLNWQNIAKMTILVVAHDAHTHHTLIQNMQKYFPNHTFPACTLIPVQTLALPEMLLEIDATAYRFHQR